MSRCFPALMVLFLLAGTARGEPPQRCTQEDEVGLAVCRARALYALHLELAALVPKLFAAAEVPGDAERTFDNRFRIEMLLGDGEGLEGDGTLFLRNMCGAEEDLLGRNYDDCMISKTDAWIEYLRQTFLGSARL